CGNDGRVHTSVDDGDTWVARNNGLGVVQIYPGISVHPSNSTFLLGGMQDNGTNRRDAGLSWSQRIGGDGGYTALHPANPNTMFAEFQGTGNLYRSTNGGTNFNLSNSGIVGSDRNCFLPPVAFSPFNSSTIFYGTHRVYRSINTGMNWTPISGDLTSGGTAAIRGLVIAPSDVQTVYVTTNDGRLLVSTDGGVNFTPRLAGIPGWVRVKREVAVDPTDDAIAYLAVAHFGVDQIRKTVNHGLSWTTIDGDLPDVPVNTVAVEHQGSTANVFLGTDAGVYMSCDSGGHWRKMGASLPNVPVMDLVVDIPFQRLVAGTLGRGAWSVPLPPMGDADMDADVDLRDYRQFGICFSGAIDQPGFVSPSLVCLQSFDFEGDGDVDLGDYLCYSGQLEGP
ncbi:MAG: hypothetical protein AABZ47_04370, partial [Planctomycetota bacterium]